MAEETDVVRLVRAVEREIEEHGRPNAFYLAELELRGAPSKMRVGALAKRGLLTVPLARLGAEYVRGDRKQASCVLVSERA